MGIFGKRPMGYYANQAAPREALGLGSQGIMPGDMPDYGGIPNQPPQVRGGGFFGAGGTGRNIAGYLGDALLRMGGGQAMYAPQMQQRQDQAEEDKRWQHRFELEQQAKKKPQFLNTKTGAIAIDPDTMEVTQLSTAPPETTTLEDNIAFIRKLRPNLTDEQAAEMAQRALSGYQYSPEGVQARIGAAGQIAEVQGIARDRHRAPVRGGSSKPPPGFILD